MNLPYEKDVSVHPFQLWEISEFDNLQRKLLKFFFNLLIRNVVKCPTYFRNLAANAARILKCV